VLETINGAVPFETVFVYCPVELSVVNAPVLGVVPPMAPGTGNEDVDPPSATDVPPIVIEGLTNPVFGNDAFVTPLRLPTTVAIVPLVVTSPVKLPVLTVGPLAHSVRLLVVIVPLVLTFPPPAGVAQLFVGGEPVV